MNISNVKDCYGCGVCAKACSKKIIDLCLNTEGFYEPYITDPNKCTDCGLCRDVCAFLHSELALDNSVIKAYAAWSNNEQVHRKCSSGGVGFEIERTLLNKNYNVCAVRYNAEDNRAEHYVASDINQLTQSAGSKYIQSYTVAGFKEIDRKLKYLVTGTPCQIDSFRRYIKKFCIEENYVLIDFFCHGVPSMLAWKKYLKWVAPKVGKVTYASWRNKQTKASSAWTYGKDDEEFGQIVPWKFSYNMIVNGDKGSSQVKLADGDKFLTLFLGNCCLGKQCYETCKYKRAKSSADIRLGDFWGGKYKANTDGVSSVITFSQLGDDILHKTDCVLIEHTFEEAVAGQMIENAKKSPVLDKVMDSLKNETKNIVDAYRFISAYKKKQRLLRIISKPWVILNKFK